MLGKSTEKQSTNFKNVWCIKCKDKRVLSKETEVIKREKKYFEGVLNEEFP